MREISGVDSRPKNQLVSLLFIHLKVVFFNLKEFFLALFRYPEFLKIDLALYFSYFFKSPFAISKEFLQKRNAEEIYSYGQTPLSTLDKIARECRLTSADVVYDLGCGNGRGAFWLATMVGCTVHGIEIIPQFVEKALKIKRRTNCKNAFFSLQDMVSANLSEATFIYFYLFDEEVTAKMIEKFSELEMGTKIVTISEPLPAPFKLLSQFEGRFPWGKTELYLHSICKAER